MKLPFASNAQPTLGVEIELALVDHQTMALRSAILPILERLPEKAREGVKPELFQCTLEINSGVCKTVDDAGKDLLAKLKPVQQAADEEGIRLLWAGSHPFSRWRDQEISPTDRYQNLIELFQDTVRQAVTFGLHVHVGVDSGEKAILICNRLTEHLPLLLALSCNSPFWDNRVTGLQSSRSQVTDRAPTAGLPHQMGNWSEYTWLIDHLVATGFINTIREIWWDVRPHHNFGTVEVRMCDMPPDLDEVLILTALIQCLVVHFSDRIDEGSFPRDAHPMMVRQNKWRACRFGRKAKLVDSYTYASRTIPEVAQDWSERLMPIAERLGCQQHLKKLPELAQMPSGADRQLALLREVGSSVELVRRLTSV
jgi:glutamate---cysteine ligase / carboxylate-amine ligase